MQRTLEPELMNDAAGSAAYAGGDLNDAYWLFIHCFRKYLANTPPTGNILDLGCGPAGVPVRLARLFPGCVIHGVDGAREMLVHARKAICREGLEQRIHLHYGILPDKMSLPQDYFQTIISNNFLHHLANPQIMWQAIMNYGRPGTGVLIIDLIRPTDAVRAQLLVDRSLPNAPDSLRRNMLNSLHAAFTVEEVQSQLAEAGLADQLTLTLATPFQLAVYGHLAPADAPRCR